MQQQYASLGSNQYLYFSFFIFIIVFISHTNHSSLSLSSSCCSLLPPNPLLFPPLEVIFMDMFGYVFLRHLWPLVTQKNICIYTYVYTYNQNLSNWAQDMLHKTQIMSGTGSVTNYLGLMNLRIQEINLQLLYKISTTEFHSKCLYTHREVYFLTFIKGLPLCKRWRLYKKTATN